MTIEQIKKFPSYDALKRNGLDDNNIIQYYSLPKGQRAAFFGTFKSQPTVTFRVPKPQRVICSNSMTSTKGDIDAIREMALELMETTFTYRGVDFNAKQLGWKFAFGNRKTALGTCYMTKKKIELSQFFVENGEREMKMWKNTMIHELAHAMNWWYYGGRGHDRRWKDIFISWGGNGQRTSGDTVFNDLVENPVSKYTLVCPNGHTRPSHKRSRAVEQGRRSCPHCSNKFDRRYVLKQIQNY